MLTTVEGLQSEIFVPLTPPPVFTHHAKDTVTGSAHLVPSGICQPPAFQTPHDLPGLAFHHEFLGVTWIGTANSHVKRNAQCISKGTIGTKVKLQIPHTAVLDEIGKLVLFFRQKVMSSV